MEPENNELDFETKLARSKYVNRELSWIKYNGRILDMAVSSSEKTPIPVLERLKFLDIYQRNLTEFFQVRVGSLINEVKEKKDSKDICMYTPNEQISLIYSYVKDDEFIRYCAEGILMDDLYSLLRFRFVPSLTGNIYSSILMNQVLVNNEREIFKKGFLPYLFYTVVKCKEPFPFLKNKKSYVLTYMTHKVTGKKRIGIVDTTVAGKEIEYKNLNTSRIVMDFADYLILNISSIFPDYYIQESVKIRITRNADVILTDRFIKNYDDNVIAAIHAIDGIRETMEPVRIEINHEISKKFKRKIYKNLGLPKQRMLTNCGAFDYRWIINFIKYQKENHPDIIMPLLTNEKADAYFKPLPNNVYISEKDNNKNINNIFEKKEPTFFEYPFASMENMFSQIINLAKTGVVQTVSLTLYRCDETTVRFIDKLCTYGCKVNTVIETRARFDEINNVDLIDRILQNSLGSVTAVSGGFKVHAKIMVIELSEPVNNISKFAYIGTGNFNCTTAKQYIDFGYITTDEEIVNIARAVIFSILANKQNTLKYVNGKAYRVCLSPFADIETKKDIYYNEETWLPTTIFDSDEDKVNVSKQTDVLISPINLRSVIENQIFNERMKRKEGYILLKVNSLTDKRIIDELVTAALEGCKIDLIVRGSCCLNPNHSGLDNIHVYSVVGPLLEHHRVYYFGSKKEYQRCWIGSADMMPRNLDRRVEVAVKVDSDTADSILYILNTNYIKYKYEHIDTGSRRNDITKRSMSDYLI